jgi:hypothetical protein
VSKQHYAYTRNIGNVRRERSDQIFLRTSGTLERKNQTMEPLLPLLLGIDLSTLWTIKIIMHVFINKKKLLACHASQELVQGYNT